MTEVKWVYTCEISPALLFQQVNGEVCVMLERAAYLSLSTGKVI